MSQVRRARYNVSPERFVEVWQQSVSVREVALTLGMPIGVCHARASNYRKRGVRLKAMPRQQTGGPPLDVDKLNRLAAQSWKNQ